MKKLTPRVNSPFCLIQEELRDDPWKMLIACMMLNLTNIKQVRPIIFEFFKKFPNPSSVEFACEDEIANLIRTLGFYNRRARMIKKFSKAYLLDGWKNVMDLPGVGKYAADSYRIFIEGFLDVEPTDSKLIKYLEWTRTL